MSIRLDYIRLLIDDNGPVKTYTDNQLTEALSLNTTVPTEPAAVRLAAIAAFHKFPVGA